VTLSLHDRTEKPVRLSVEPDQKTVKDNLISWVGYYNQLMTEVNILSQTNEKIVSELEYLSEDERKSALERLGLFQGDFTLSQVKSSMQRLTTSPYATREADKLSLLAQIGISTNASSSTSSAGYNAAKLRGYLEVDEAKLDENLKARMTSVKDLFGNDTDGDLITDSGISYALDALFKPYVETAGILSLKQQTYADKVDRQKKAIADLDAKLIAKEKELRVKYGQMESSLNSMEKTSNSLNNFSKNNSGN
jgi:flagellar hook-associated protein 2